MTNKEKTTVPESFVGANEEQPQVLLNNNSIADTKDAGKQNISINEPTTDGCPETEHPLDGQLRTHSLTEILDATFLPQVPLIENFLYVGTYILAGSPKIGKSFLMAQIAFHVSKGRTMWDLNVNQGTVLYLALEDTYARIQKRLSRMFDMEESEHLHFAIKAKAVQQGLENQLVNFLSKHPDTRLIIIDTLQKVRELGSDKNLYGSDYDVISHVKQLADLYHICVIFVHHTRKQKASDVFEEISGSQGLMGAADGAILIKKEKRTSNKAIIEISGRDQPDAKLEIIRDVERCYWKLEKMDSDLWKEPPDPLIVKIADKLTEENPAWSGTATELLAFLEESDLAANVLTRKLNTQIDNLLTDFNIHYRTEHKHKERMIYLEKIIDN